MPTAETPAKAGGAEAAIGYIVVTAQKRSEIAQAVPISITAVSAETLKLNNITTLIDVQLIAPGLAIARVSNNANQRVTLRGIGSSTATAIERSVATFLDGVCVPRPPSIVGDLLDVGTIEVLRGPQGTLFGRNASMGAIAIRTADPGAERAMTGMLTLGSYDHVRAKLSVACFPWAITHKTQGIDLARYPAVARWFAALHLPGQERGGDAAVHRGGRG